MIIDTSPCVCSPSKKYDCIVQGLEFLSPFKFSVLEDAAKGRNEREGESDCKKAMRRKTLGDIAPGVGLRMQRNFVISCPRGVSEFLLPRNLCSRKNIQYELGLMIQEHLLSNGNLALRLVKAYSTVPISARMSPVFMSGQDTSIPSSSRMSVSAAVTQQG